MSESILRNTNTATAIKYNGVTFPPPTIISITSNTVYDSTNRVVRHVDHTLKVEVVIVKEDNLDGLATSFTSTDQSLEAIRQKLMTPRGVLVLSGLGFGSLTTVGPAQGRAYEEGDIDFGPHPKLLTWQPIGYDKACRVVWEVTFSVPECDFFTGSWRAKSFAYGVTFDIDMDGTQSRSIVGSLEIVSDVLNEQARTPMDRRKDVSDTFPSIPGFRRTQNYSASEDQRFLNFSIVDREIPTDNPYFPGCVAMDFNHSISSRLLAEPMQGAGFITWACNISGSLQLKPDFPKRFAIEYFLKIIELRTGEFLKKIPKDEILIDLDPIGDEGETMAEPTKSEAKAKPSFLPLGMELEEELFGRGWSFSFDYLLKSSKGKVAWNEAQLGTPIDTDWDAWLVEQVGDGNPHGVSGSAGLQARSRQNLIDSCNSNQALKESKFRILYDKAFAPEKKPEILTPSKPESRADSQWRYVNESAIVESDKVVTVGPVNKQVPKLYVDNQGSSVEGKELGTYSPTDFEQKAKDKGEVQVFGPPSYTLSMVGSCLTVGYSFNPPRVIKYAGAEFHRSYKRTSVQVPIVGNPSVYATTWILEYVTNEVPNKKALHDTDTTGRPEFNI